METEEFKTFLVEHPVQAYFKCRSGLLEQVLENGEDFLTEMSFFFGTCWELIKYIGIAVYHLICVIFYPVYKALLLRSTIKDILEERKGR